ncbi:GTPase [Clostridium transplantifaecale]|uniref:GTPase n=1 Tax=Clostridium transplantifaecale TaxID=2479838 RepID=UPI000F64460C|nr:GTPase [Clostridium transplantifaecale]
MKEGYCDFDINDFDLNSELEKLQMDIQKPNILVCGGTGVGKSSLINNIFGKEVAEIGHGVPLTRGIKKYSSTDTSVNLYDSEGYETGSERQSYYENNILSILNENAAVEEKIHEVWYCISAANKRIFDIDQKMICTIKDKGIPVTAVLTQIDGVDEIELTSLILSLRQIDSNLKYFTYCTLEDSNLEEYIQRDELIRWSLDQLPEALKAGFISSVYGALEEKKEYVKNVVIRDAVAQALAAVYVPIPGSDALLLAPIQMRMVSKIIKTYGTDKVASLTTSLLESQVMSYVGKNLSKAVLGSMFKFIPGIGTGVSNVINSGIATIMTKSLGEAMSQMCYKYSNARLRGEDVELVKYFNPETISDLIETIRLAMQNQ